MATVMANLAVTAVIPEYLVLGYDKASILTTYIFMTELPQYLRGSKNVSFHLIPNFNTCGVDLISVSEPMSMQHVCGAKI